MCYGNVYAYQKQIDRLKSYYVEAIMYAEKIGNKKMLADTYFEIANNYFVYGMGMKNYTTNFPVAIDYFLKALSNMNLLATGKEWQIAGSLFRGYMHGRPF